MNIMEEIIQVLVDIARAFYRMRVVSPQHGDDEFQARILHCDATGKTYIVNIREIKSAVKIPDAKPARKFVNRISNL